MRPLVHSRLVALVGLFVALCLAYNVATPLYEAPDERDHVDYTGWLAGGNGFPHLVADREEVGEIWQPPLYYALVAAVIAPLDRAELDSIAPLSEDWQAGLSRLAHYHTAAESFPFRGAALTVHVARLVSTALGLITVLAAYAIARLLFPDDDRARRYALVAATLVALNPQFIFMSAAVNNDNLVIALCSVAIWLLVRALIKGLPADGRARTGWFVLLGLVWGAAVLAKLTGLTLGLVIGLTLLYLARRERSWRTLLLGGALTGGTMLLVCGWWFLRNWQLYGDPLAWDEMLAVTGALVRPELLPWPDTLRYATFLRQSYWAAFGYGVLAPDSFYLMTTIIMAVALVGLIVYLLRARRTAGGPRQFAFLILMIWSLTVFLFLLRWMRLIDTTNQGRLLFPAIAALGVPAAVGLAAFDGRRRHWVSTTAVVILGMWAAAMPTLVLRPAFAQPLPIVPETVAHPTDFRFGEAIRLVGYELPAATEPDRPLELALYWQATAPVGESYVVATRILDAEGRVATGVDELPFGGRYSTAVWEPGKVFRDSISLPPVSTSAAPGLGSLLVIIYPRGEPDAPLAVTVGDTPVGNEAYVARLKITPSVPVTLEPPKKVDALFGGRFRLLGYDNVAETMEPGWTIAPELLWQAERPDGRDYTIFVHLIDAEGRLLAQDDAPPQQGRYPTSIWEDGERVVDLKFVKIPYNTPPGEVTLWVGVYDPVTGERLPATRTDGSRYDNDAVPLISIRIAE